MGLDRLDDNESSSCPKHMVYCPVQGLTMFIFYQVEGIPTLNGKDSAWPGYFAGACSRRLPDPCPRRADRGMDNSKSTSPACASNHGGKQLLQMLSRYYSQYRASISAVRAPRWGLEAKTGLPAECRALQQCREERDPQGELTRLTDATPSQTQIHTKTSSHKIHRLSSTKNFYTTLERVQ